MTWQKRVCNILEKCLILVFDSSLSNAVLFAMLPVYFVFLMAKFRADFFCFLELDGWVDLIFIIIGTFLYMNCFGNLLQNAYTYVILRDHVGKENCIKNIRDIIRSTKGCLNYGVACVGMHSKRFYFLYLCYFTILVSLVSVLTCYFISAKFSDENIIEHIIQLLRINSCNILKITELQIYLYFMLINLAILMTCLVLVIYRSKNYLNSLPGGCSCKDCLVLTFGTKWYLAMVCPFADSPALKDDLSPQREDEIEFKLKLS